MSILQTGTDANNQPTAKPWTISMSKLTPKNQEKLGIIGATDYKLDDKQAGIRNLMLKNFALGYVTMYKPRVEFNDLSVISRMNVDQMAFNTYQPNNGEGFEGDEINGWRSNAIRPIERNKCISVAAHATARLIFPKVFAYDEDNNVDVKSAQVMEDLMEWAGDQTNGGDGYSQTSLRAVITSLTDPASIVMKEYAEVYRTVKRPDGKGSYTEERILDETLSGFQDTQVPVDELYIENFYEPDIQKQGWLIRRRVIGYGLAEGKYSGVEAFRKYVRPGVQLVYNDANSSFYQVYDTNMRPEDVEEITMWHRQLDLKVTWVNGVFMTPADNPNPRYDKFFPFVKFGYEMINARCFYYKSLVFKMQHDAGIINTLYPMIIDGTYLNVMPPMVAIGHEAIGSDVVIPGAVTTFSDPNADLRPIQTSMNLKTGMETMMKVEESINNTSIDPVQQGQQTSGDSTAYEISKIEENAATVLGLFIKSISSFVKQYGILLKGDILQYKTLGEAKEVDGPIVYQSFLLPDKIGGDSTKKIQFDLNAPTSLTDADALAQSYKIMMEQGGPKSKISLQKVNPEKFRNNKYHMMITPDVLNPRSDQLERAYDLETYDRAITNPILDQEEVTKDFLLRTNPRSKKNPDKYINKNPQPMAGQNIPGQPSPTEAPAAPGAQAMKRGMPYQSPLASAMKQKNTKVAVQ